MTDLYINIEEQIVNSCSVCDRCGLMPALKFSSLMPLDWVPWLHWAATTASITTVTSEFIHNIKSDTTVTGRRPTSTKAPPARLSVLLHVTVVLSSSIKQTRKHFILLQTLWQKDSNFFLYLLITQSAERLVHFILKNKLLIALNECCIVRSVLCPGHRNNH